MLNVKNQKDYYFLNDISSKEEDEY